MNAGGLDMIGKREGICRYAFDHPLRYEECVA